MDSVAILTLLTQIIMFILIVSIIFRSSPITLALRVTDQILITLTGAPIQHLSQITSQLYVGGQHHKRGLSKMQALGINAIVNMRESKYDDRIRDIAPENYLHLPTIDGTPPTIEHLCMGVKFIKHEISQGSTVYIHCASGFHRAPTMAAAYLISTGLTMSEALLKIRKVRPFAKPIKSQKKQLELFSTEIHKCV